MRVFAGLPLPQSAVKKAVAAIESIQRVYKGLNFVKPSGLHITILFFGEVPESEAAKISTLMETPELKIPKIKTRLSNIGQFPPKGNPRVIFIDLAGNTDKIVSYQRQYQKLITGAGIQVEPDDKPFLPHVTIARNKREQLKPGFLAGIPALDLDFEFDRLILFQSVLSTAGADYTPIKTVMFQ